MFPEFKWPVFRSPLYFIGQCSLISKKLGAFDLTFSFVKGDTLLQLQVGPASGEGGELGRSPNPRLHSSNSHSVPKRKTYGNFFSSQPLEKSPLVHSQFFLVPFHTVEYMLTLQTWYYSQVTRWLCSLR